MTTTERMFYVILAAVDLISPVQQGIAIFASIVAIAVALMIFAVGIARLAVDFFKG